MADAGCRVSRAANGWAEAGSGAGSADALGEVVGTWVVAVDEDAGNRKEMRECLVEIVQDRWEWAR
jgi:hypothetical protein